GRVSCESQAVKSATKTDNPTPPPTPPKVDYAKVRDRCAKRWCGSGAGLAGRCAGLQACGEARGVPAGAAHRLDFGIELVDQRRYGQMAAVGAGLVEHQAEILAHPVHREAEVELPARHGLPAVVHLPRLRRAPR